MSFEELMEDVARGFEIVGVLVLLAGFAFAVVRAARVRSKGDEAVYRELRVTFARSLLLGLEILIAADLIRTVAVEPSLENVAVLGMIVLIRTLLSFSLEVEIDGTLPWRRRLPPAE